MRKKIEIRNSLLVRTATIIRYSIIMGLLLVSVNTMALGQTSYNDVMVISNSNSSISTQIANYFKTARNIPTNNMCSISCTTEEEIDSVTFEQIRTLIQNYMTSKGIVNSINYIVTTKGIPLRVKRSGSTFSPNSTSSSFESDLALIFSNYATSIGKASAINNPYYQATSHFSRSTFGNMYLVTRLDGYTYNDVKGLIDRAKSPYYSTGKFVFDQDPSKNSSLNTKMTTAASTLTSRSFNVLNNTTNQFIVEQTNALGYVSWGTNDSYYSQYTQKAQPHFSWSPKALVETYVSSSGRTFSDSTYIDPAIGSWQSLIADLIHENGITGGKGYVFEPYSSSMAKVDILFDRWTTPNLTNAFNLAEALYSASSFLSWMDVFIGDPKAKFAAEGHLPVQLVSLSGSVINGQVNLQWSTATEINNYGFEIQKRVNDSWKTLGFVPGHGTSNTPQSYSFTDGFVAQRNVYRLKQIDRDGAFEFSHEIDVFASSSVRLNVLQNFPNPFNPTTTITYSLASESNVAITIGSVSGQIVSEFKQKSMQQPGTYSIMWDGSLANGSPAPSGTYFYRISATNPATGEMISTTKRMTLIR